MRRVIAGIYRARVVIMYISVMIIFAGTVGAQVIPIALVKTVLTLLPLVGIVGMLLVLAVLVPGLKLVPNREPLTVAAPVTGRWSALNSPATQVPSHGVRAYGQTYAVDLVFDPKERARPAFDTGMALRYPNEYPAFGEPVRAMIDGVVVRASDAQRDHRARSSVLGYIYMLMEGTIREIGGPRLIIGNHITIRGEDGVFALIAHVKQHSALVAVGDTVVAGQPIAACGNSGNSSEPHVHAQLMDRASAWTGHGLPMLFADIVIDDETEKRDAMPAENEHLTAL
ncbi:peptidase M23-like protein [Salinibacterium amurskyense]|uniref:Peptidase M23-like protein n=1 Tax=Salinibacterium amurskyense TaxID=205941 RepID=A0A2M9DA12_9MICO|nr:M23 family metallopeptidase [Salinibacterium amurskyense]PJJ82567.1 peptidase M23-like protein [Salinibacterium amurskyense]RLQ82305.1 M23 family metallopeptidase [Salinibacterium amurskyense]